DQKIDCVQQLDNVLEFPQYNSPDEDSCSESLDDDTEISAVPIIRRPKRRRNRRLTDSSDFTELKSIVSDVVEEILKHRLPPIQASQHQASPQVTAAATQSFSASDTPRPPRRCWFCGRLGHVHRFCRTRQSYQHSQGFSAPKFPHRSAYPIYNATISNPAYATEFPSFSPTQRRQSRSPSPSPARVSRSASPRAPARLSGNQR